MLSEVEMDSWERLRELAESGDLQALEGFLTSLAPKDLARAISRLNLEEQSNVISMLTPAGAAGLLDDIPAVCAADIIEQLNAEDAASIVHQLPSDEQADLIGGLAESDAEAILAELPLKAAAKLRSLAAYPADVAGGLMITEYLAFPAHATIGEVSASIRDGQEDYSDFDVQYVYVVSAEGSLIGVLRLRDLLLSKPDRRLSEVMIESPVFVDVNTPLDELKEIFERYEYFGVPVTGENARLLGVLRRGAVTEAVSERSDEDFLKSQGIVGGEELRSMPILERAWRRLSWLSINVVLNIAAASVIAYYESTLTAVVALAVFLPIISDMSGCSGNQAAAVSLREMALGILKPYEIFHVWVQEISVGLINGLALGSLIALVAYFWKGNPFLGLVVGAALALNTVVAVSIGGAIPMLLKRAGKDPALASGPILTTITDMCGFLLVLSLATALLAHL